MKNGTKSDASYVWCHNSTQNDIKSYFKDISCHWNQKAGTKLQNIIFSYHLNVPTNLNSWKYKFQRLFLPSYHQTVPQSFSNNILICYNYMASLYIVPH